MKKIVSIIFLIFILFGLVACQPDGPIVNPPAELKEYYHGEVLSLDIDNNYAEILNVPFTSISEDIEVKKIVDGELIDSNLEDLLVGANNVYVAIGEDDTIRKIIIDGESIFNYIRVAIRNNINDIANEQTLTHNKITLDIPFDTTIKEYDNSKSISLSKGSLVEFTVEQSKIKMQTKGYEEYFDKRVIVEEGNGEIKVSSIKRAHGTPSYAGKMDISLKDSKLLLINEVNMEDYLTKVVPAEMPSSWNMEALKAQAVAARTYAYKEIYNKTYIKDAYVVDDSTMSQVYNNQKTNERSTNAVKETKGITMFNNNMPIVAYYYSSSAGITGSGNEVWIKNGVIEEIPYLIGKNLTDIEVDTSSEESLLNFFKTINMTSPSGNSSNFRWLVTISKEQLRNTLNVNLKNMIPQYKESYLVLENDEWIQKDYSNGFPNDIGEISKIYVSERGKSGVVISLTVEAANVTFKIYNQYNIRFTIRPRTSDCGSSVSVNYAKANSGKYTSSNTNVSILPSGYFALEEKEGNILFYGGGSGHGVGMCQYSANYYGTNGWLYQDILKQFYSNIEFKDTSSTYIPLDQFEDYFK